MITVLNVRYRRFWKKVARYRAHTSSYKMFIAMINSDHQYKKMVDTYILSTMTDIEKQRLLEATNNFAKPLSL